MNRLIYRLEIDVDAETRWSYHIETVRAYLENRLKEAVKDVSAGPSPCVTLTRLERSGYEGQET